MPWRSNTGVPFGNAIYDNPECFEGSEASGLSGDAAILEPQHDFSGSVVEGHLDVKAFSIADSQPGHADGPNGVQFDSELVAAEPARKRQALDMALQKGTGPDKRLFFNMLKLRRTGVPKMPWDTGVAAEVFKKGPISLPMPWLSLPTVGKRESLQGLVPSAEPPERTASRTPFHKRRLLTVRLAQTDDQLRAKAMRRLRDLILAMPSHTQLGRALLDTSGQLTGEDMISCVFADAFRSRATATLVKRSCF